MWSFKLTLVMLVIESLEMGLNTISKAAMSRGMSNFVFVVYSNTFAIPFLLLSCLLFHRRKPPPPLTTSILCRIFVLGLIRYSSPTLASAMTDLVPAFTFILAIITRMENLDLRVRSSRAKSIGTIMSITGALTMTMYEGPPVAFTSLTSTKLNGNVTLPQSNWVIGGILSAIAAFMLAVLFVFQTSIIRAYPAELMVTLICCTFVAMQSSIVSLMAERNPSAWRLRPDIELIAIVYSAVLVVGLRSVASAWVMRRKGPFFAAMFKPVGIIIAVVMGVTFLGDTLYLGSVVGAAIIAIGFYTVMWGKDKEETLLEDVPAHGMESSSHNVPLLQNKTFQA
ncbi:WAT1-related protein [Vitis vinifera]|uniref:WAT1-related protein n=1 Tax=Vitis vinifera TaxID=29760 RepID=A0A438EHK7_VITVI|nr:WAT1-related protein [Vitis vinifera]